MGSSTRKRLSRRVPPLDRLTVFGFLWAAAAIFEQAKWGDWAASPPDLAFSLTAFWLLFRPWSVSALLAATGGNHLLVGRGVRLAPYQDDLVAIQGSSDPELEELGRTGYALPYFEFRSYISLH